MNMKPLYPAITSVPALYRHDANLSDEDKRVMDFLTRNPQLSLEEDVLAAAVAENCGISQTIALASLRNLMSNDYLYCDYEGAPDELLTTAPFVNPCPIKFLLGRAGKTPMSASMRYIEDSKPVPLSSPIDAMDLANSLQQFSRSNFLGRVNTMRALLRFFEIKGEDENLLSIVVGEDLEPDTETRDYRQQVQQPQMGGILVSDHRIYVYRDMAELVASEAGDFEFEPVENDHITNINAVRAWPITSVSLTYSVRGTLDSLTIGVNGNFDSSGKVLSHFNNGLRAVAKSVKGRPAMAVFDYDVDTRPKRQRA